MPSVSAAARRVPHWLSVASISWRSSESSVVPTGTVISLLSEDIVSRIPDSRLEVFEQSGHMPMIEESEKFLTVLRGFLHEA